MKIRLEIHSQPTFENVPTNTNKSESIELAGSRGCKPSLVNQILFQMLVCISVFWDGLYKCVIYKAEGWEWACLHPV